jgi:glycosyltransferase involved in cell wall biosynthesis
MLPLVSICIPAFNSEKWIRSTIRSALNQTWDNKEIIIVDDGSTDNTYNIAKEYESSIMKVYKQKNSGACTARNQAFSLSKGDFIQWLDSDDIIDANKLSFQLSDENNYNNPLVIHTASWGYFYYRLSKADFKPNHLWRDLSPKDWLIERFSKGSFMPCHSFLVSRELTEKVGPWDSSLHRNQDGEYFSRVVSHSSLVKFHTSSKCYYRKGNNTSISSFTDVKTITSMIISMEKSINNLLRIEDSKKSRQASIKYFQYFYNTYYFANNKYLTDLVQMEILTLGGNLEKPLYNKTFLFFSKIFGYQFTIRLKEFIWRNKVRFKRTIDKLFYFLFKD